MLASAALLLLTVGCNRWSAPFRISNAASGLRAVSHRPLPLSDCRVRWDAHTVPAVLPRDSSADVRITFTNLGDVVWPDVLAGDPATRDGGYAVRLAYGWAEESEPAGTPVNRVDLPHPAHPGETVTLLVPLEAPVQPGRYRITFALVQELVIWFQAAGAPTLVVPVTVR